MREILFRAKPIDDKDFLWVNSDGFVYGAPAVPYKTLFYAYYKPYKDDGDYSLVPIEVDPSTIGQYTGLTDKNGKKIFEGDIYTWRDDYNDYHACLICFGKYFDGYANKYATMANGFYIKTLQGETFNFAGAGYSEIKISGNIYDNPELLEEQA